MFSGRLMRGSIADDSPVPDRREVDVSNGQVGDPTLFAQHRAFQPAKASIAFAVFAGAIAMTANDLIRHSG